MAWKKGPYVIDITKEQLARMKLALAEIKEADRLATDKEIIPVISDQIGMQNLLAGSMYLLQDFVEICEEQEQGRQEGAQLDG